MQVYEKQPYWPIERVLLKDWLTKKKCFPFLSPMQIRLPLAFYLSRETQWQNLIKFPLISTCLNSCFDCSEGTGNILLKFIQFLNPHIVGWVSIPLQHILKTTSIIRWSKLAGFIHSRPITDKVNRRIPERI